jgi:hypothetical protein
MQVPKQNSVVSAHRVHLSDILSVLESWGSAFGIATGCGLNSRFRYPTGASYFPLVHNVQAGSGAHTALYGMGIEGSFRGLKRPGHEADYSPPITAEAKNDGAIHLFTHTHIYIYIYIYMTWCLIN